MLGEPVKLNIDGEETHNTFLGALFSFIIFGITVYFAQEKFIVMINYQDTSHTKIIESDYIPLDDPITIADTDFEFMYGLYSRRNNG